MIDVLCDMICTFSQKPTETHAPVHVRKYTKLFSSASVLVHVVVCFFFASDRLL